VIHQIAEVNLLGGVARLVSDCPALQGDIKPGASWPFRDLEEKEVKRRDSRNARIGSFWSLRD
jgi:hypothetical protein